MPTIDHFIFDPVANMQQRDAGRFIAYIERAALKLGILDVLKDDGGSTLFELAGLLGLDGRALAFFLSALCELGYVESMGGYFGVTDFGRSVVACEIPAANNPPNPFDSLWSFLSEAIREGGPQVHRVFEEHTNFFSACYEDPDRLRDFCNFMLGFSVPAGREIAREIDFSESREVLAVAGGLGGMLHEIMFAHQHLRGTILESPRVCDIARDYLAHIGTRASRRIGVQAGDLVGSYPNADVVLLDGVLASWSDESALRILQHSLSCLPRGGRVVLSEFVLGLGEERRGYPSLLSLILLLAYERGARTRTKKEFFSLLEKAGFADLRYIVVPDGRGNIIVGRKP